MSDPININITDNLGGEVMVEDFTSDDVSGSNQIVFTDGGDS